MQSFRRFPNETRHSGCSWWKSFPLLEIISSQLEDRVSVASGTHEKRTRIMSFMRSCSCQPFISRLNLYRQSYKSIGKRSAHNTKEQPLAYPLKRPQPYSIPLVQCPVTGSLKYLKLKPQIRSWRLIYIVWLTVPCSHPCALRGRYPRHSSVITWLPCCDPS